MLVIRPSVAVGDQLAHALDRGGVAVVVADGGGDAGLAGGGGDLGGLAGVAADRLLDPERLAGLRGGDADLAVQHVRRADGDHVDVGVGEDLAVVGGAALVAQHVLGVLDAVRGGVGGDHQPALEAQLGVDRGHGLVGAGVQLAHPADADQAHADLTGLTHDRNSFRGRGKGDQPSQSCLDSPASYSVRRRWTVSSSDTSEGATSHHAPAPGRSMCGMTGTTMTTGPWWPRVSSSARAHLGGGVRADGAGAEALRRPARGRPRGSRRPAAAALAALRRSEVERARAVAELVAELACRGGPSAAGGSPGSRGSPGSPP